MSQGKTTAHPDVKYVFSSDPELLLKGFGLRYMHIHDRLNAVEENPEGIYMDACDSRSIGLFAIEGECKVIGFVNYVPPGDDMPFSDKTLLEEICGQYGQVGACNGFYVMKTRQTGRVGVLLSKTFMNAAATWDIGALVTEANPDIAKGLERFGWSTLKHVPSSHGGKDLPSALMVAPLKPMVEKRELAYATNSGEPTS